MNRTHWLLGAVVVVLLILALRPKIGAKARFSFTFYHLPGCKYCEEAKPAWKQMRRVYGGEVMLRKVNAQRVQQEVNMLGIDAFPTFILFDSKTGYAYQYQGARTAQAFCQFLAEKKAEITRT